MNSKIIAIIAVVVVAIAGAATAIILMQPKETVSYDASAFNIVSRVNSEGSGLYVKNTIADTSGAMPVRISNGVPFFGEGYTYTEANKEAWGGLIFGDPGNQSIQHVQLATIASGVGLKFAQYKEGQDTSNDTLYYVTNLNNYGVIIADTNIQGGIVWEPQFEKVIQESPNYTKLALTNDVFKGHACCIIAANHDWLGNNSGEMVKFLAGYIKAVDFINTAKANTSSPEYAELRDIAIAATGGVLTSSEVDESLKTITYLYADDAEGSLGDLTKNVADLADGLNDLGLITSKKFSSGEKVAKALVDDKYLKDTIAGKAKKGETSTVKVAVIQGDIHQLAIHVAKEKGYFDEYGLTVSLSTGGSGGDIVTLLTSKDVQIGFLGAPPATLKTINSDCIVVG